MSQHLLKAVKQDGAGPEVVLRVIGEREPPARMAIQIAVTGSASVQLQGRISREAPWHNLDGAHGESALFHINAVQFLRAVVSSATDGTTVSAWAVWAW